MRWELVGVLENKAVKSKLTALFHGASDEGKIRGGSQGGMHIFEPCARKPSWVVNREIPG